MSILHTLLKYIDVVQYMEKEKDARKKREVKPGDVDEDDFDIPPPPPLPKRLLECRICRSAGEGRYCPRCLAETMEPIRRR
jgi:hypothetical protein